MTARDKLRAIRGELKAQFIERDRLVDGALLALLSRQHLLVLGPPGTAKSMLAKALCARVGGERYFEWLLTKFTTPEELFGPVSLSALEAGRYERITDGKLPVAHVAFLDEVFKASSAILNALLTLLNERRFHTGSEAVQVPLLSLIAASNELPDEDALAALYDRFLLRFTVGYIEHDYKFARLLQMEDAPATDPTTLSPPELFALQAEVPKVSVPDGVVREIIELRRTLQADGVVASDRRYRQAMTVLRAAAVLEGRDAVAMGDLAWLEHVLWSEPEEQAKVAEALGRALSGFEEDARRLLFQAKEIHAYAYRPWPDADARARAVLESLAKLQQILQKLQGMRADSAQRGRDVEAMDRIVDEVSALESHLKGEAS